MCKVATKKYRDSHNEKGLCSQCSNQVAAGKKKCQTCIDKQKISFKMKKSKGICIECNGKTEGTTRCEACNDKCAARNRVKIQNGFCLCGDKLLEGYKRCNKCLEKRREKRRKNVLEGKCQCGRIKFNGFKNCATCLDRKKRSSKTNVDNGKCISCGSKNGDKLPDALQCEVCYFKLKSVSHFGSTKMWRSIKDILLRQKFICPFSGEKLILGYNAEIDHKVSKKNGGDSSIENLQWVTKQVNRAKWTFSEDEFLNFIKQVYKYRLI